MTEYSRNKRENFIAGIRALANFLEARPELEVGSCYAGVSNYSSTKDELAAQVALMGTSEKEWGPSYLDVSKKFGESVKFEVSIAREAICERVVTGKKVVPATPAVEAQPEREVDVVEWKCPENFSLLEMVGNGK